MQDEVIGPHKKGKIRYAPRQSLFIQAIPIRKIDIFSITL